MEVVCEFGSKRQIRFRPNSFLLFRSLYYVSFRAFDAIANRKEENVLKAQRKQTACSLKLKAILLYSPLTPVRPTPAIRNQSI